MRLNGWKSPSRVRNRTASPHRIHLARPRGVSSDVSTASTTPAAFSDEFSEPTSKRGAPGPVLQQPRLLQAVPARGKPPHRHEVSRQAVIDGAIMLYHTVHSDQDPEDVREIFEEVYRWGQTLVSCNVSDDKELVKYLRLTQEELTALRRALTDKDETLTELRASNDVMKKYVEQLEARLAVFDVYQPDETSQSSMLPNGKHRVSVSAAPGSLLAEALAANGHTVDDGATSLASSQCSELPNGATNGATPAQPGPPATPLPPNADAATAPPGTNGTSPDGPAARRDSNVSVLGTDDAAPADAAGKDKTLEQILGELLDFESLVGPPSGTDATAGTAGTGEATDMAGKEADTDTDHKSLLAKQTKAAARGLAETYGKLQVAQKDLDMHRSMQEMIPGGKASDAIIDSANSTETLIKASVAQQEARQRYEQAEGRLNILVGRIDALVAEAAATPARADEDEEAAREGEGRPKKRTLPPRIDTTLGATNAPLPMQPLPTSEDVESIIRKARAAAAEGKPGGGAGTRLVSGPGDVPCSPLDPGAGRGSPWLPGDAESSLSQSTAGQGGASAPVLTMAPPALPDFEQARSRSSRGKQRALDATTSWRVQRLANTTGLNGSGPPGDGQSGRSASAPRLHLDNMAIEVQSLESPRTLDSTSMRRWLGSDMDVITPRSSFGSMRTTPRATSPWKTRRAQQSNSASTPSGPGSTAGLGTSHADVNCPNTKTSLKKVAAFCAQNKALDDLWAVLEAHDPQHKKRIDSRDLKAVLISVGYHMSTAESMFISRRYADSSGKIDIRELHDAITLYFHQHQVLVTS